MGGAPSRLQLVAGALVAVAAAARIALPYAIERAVPNAAQRVGFAASVANVDLGLLAGHVSIDGLRVAPLAAAGSRDLLQLDRLYLNLEWLALLRGELELAELSLDKPVLVLVRNPDGTIELPVPPAAESPKPSEPPAKPGAALPVRVDNLAIRGTEFHLVDGAGGPNLVDFALAELGFTNLRLAAAKIGLGEIRIAAPQLRVRRAALATRMAARAAAPDAAPAAAAPPDLRIDELEIEHAEFSVLTDAEPVSVALRLQTRGVTLAHDAPFPLELALEAGRGSLALSGQLGLNPLVWDGRVSWKDLELPIFVAAAQPELSGWLSSCVTSGEIAVKLLPAGLRASGRFGVDDLAFDDPEQQLGLGWKSLGVDVREVNVPLAGGPAPIEVAIAKVSLDAPRARYVLPNTALERLTGSSAAAGSEASAGEAPAPEGAGEQPPPPRIAIDAIEVRGGAAEFVDRSGPEPYDGRIGDLSVDVAGFQLPERTIQKLRVRGVAPEHAPFDLSGALPGASGSLALTLSRLSLGQFTPYASRAADLRIPKGDLSLKAKATLSNAGAAGKVSSRVVVHQLAIQGGPNAISVGGMPIDVALALLRDPSGDISLALPIEYSARGASEDIGVVLLGALQAAITGAITSPIKVLGAIVPEGGTAPVAFAPIAFAPGAAAPPPNAAEQLAPLASLLAQRRALGLALVGRAGPGDRLGLAERILIERVAAGRDLPSLADAGFFARRRVRSALAERGRGEPGELAPEDDALLQRYLEATEVPPDRYADLARRRAESVRDLLAAASVAVDRLAVETAVDATSDVILELRGGSTS